MKILEKATMKDGTVIQVEDWHGVHKFVEKGDTLAAYPVSKVSLDGQFAPKRNRTFRASFRFDNEKKTMEAFNKLKDGSATISDYKDKLRDPEYAECI